MDDYHWCSGTEARRSVLPGIGYHPLFFGWRLLALTIIDTPKAAGRRSAIVYAEMPPPIEAIALAAQIALPHNAKHNSGPDIVPPQSIHHHHRSTCFGFGLVVHILNHPLIGVFFKFPARFVLQPLSVHFSASLLLCWYCPLRRQR